METVVQNSQPHKLRQQSEDEQGKQFFDDLSMSEGNPFENLQLSSQLQQSQLVEENAGDNNREDKMDLRQMMLMSKKQKKKEKKMRKIKQAKERKQSRKQNRNENIKESEKSNHKPGKKMLMDSSEDQAEKQSNRQQQSANLKNKKSSKKVIKNSDDQDKLPSAHSDDSDDYSSQNEASQDEELRKMDPQSQEQRQGKRQFKKKLGKKSRKQRILQKQGFDLRELGNDGEANYELNESVDESDDSFSDGGGRKKGNKKVKREKKQKKPKLTNEQFLGKLQELGRQDEADQNDQQRYNYDSGLNQLQKLRPKKQSQNKIKIQNKYFNNLQMDIQQQQAQNQQNQLPMPEQKLQLQIKPKSTTSSRASSFLNKVQTLKKHRGLQADINQEEFDKMTKEKAKRSISQLMTKIQNEVDENEEIDIEIKAPTIAKGKSADLINNTMFIVKNLSQKQGSNGSSMSENVLGNDAKNAASQQQVNNNNKPTEKNQQINKVTKPQSVPHTPSQKSRKGVSRQQFFKQIKQSINVRKSKYISDEQLKNSMKASKLQQLQEIRKKIQEKRRKEAMYEMGELEDDDAENVINQLEADLARQKGLSLTEYRKLLRVQEGVQGLEDYDEEGDGKKNKKNNKEGVEGKQQSEPKVVLQLSVDAGVNPIKQSQQKQKEKQPSQTSIQQIQQKKKLQLQRELRIQKALAMQGQKIQQEEKSDRHADDMIEEYEGDQIKIKEDDQMELEDQGQGEEEEEELKNEDDEEDQQEEGQGQQDQPKEQQQASSQNNKIINEASIKHQQNPLLLNQLQLQGIIMPGNKKKTLNQQQHFINFSKYLVQNDNAQPIITQPLIQPTTSKPSFKIDQSDLQFKQFRKLRKIAVIIQEKKKKRQQQLKRAKQFFQQQAELGSDNQQNDDNIKAINKKDDQQQEDGDDLDQQLQELIDNAVDINEANEEEAFKKYMQDVKQKDRQELQRILRGDFRRPNHDMPQMHQMQQDERNRIQRMERMVEWMKKRQDDQKDLYAKDDSQDDEMNYYYDYNGNKKRIQKKRNNHNNEGHEEDQDQEEDNGELEKKLQVYLMDTISPSKKQSQIEIASELVMELPMMSKKSTMSRLNSFAKKPHENTSLSINENTQLQKLKETPTKNTFAGNLLSLAAPKGESNPSSMPKMKKTSSHMSEYLNKNKSQKPSSFTGTTFKLPGIFNRLGKK